jgi:tRNA-binding protein
MSERGEISWEDFERVELRVGTVVAVEDFPEARKPAYKLRVDFGPELGVKQSSAQLTRLYAKEGLVGRQVVAVVNFPRKRVANFDSEVLVTGFVQADGSVVLAVPERPVADGTRLA